MNSNIAMYQQQQQANKFQAAKHSLGSAKRKREEETPKPSKDKLNLEAENSSKTKQRPAKSFFRPWSNNEEKKITISHQEKHPKATSNHQTPVLSHQSNQQVYPNPAMGISYQMALQQRQNAMAMQQALYQRQVMMAHVWARQQLQHQQQQQHMHHLHHQLQQQQQQQHMFAYTAQQGPL